MVPARDSRPRMLPYLVSAAAVAFVAIAANVLTRYVPLPHVSVLFLAAVLTSAALWGFWPSMFAAVLSVGASSYFFYPPIFDFRVADAPNVADLGVFAVVAALTSRLAASVRAQALEAQRRQATVAALLAFSERLAASTSDEDLHAAIVEHLGAVLGRPVHLVLAGTGGPPRAVDAGWRVDHLTTDRSSVGMVLSREPAPPVDEEYRKAMLGQAALAIDRARLRGEIAEARLRMQGEALREALINSVSHDLQTPLAAILGSATALESLGEQGAPRARGELVATIRDQALRLASDIENVLDFTRIRAGQTAPRLELVELADIVNAALRRKQHALAAHPVAVSLPADLPMLRLDLFLMEHALANVLDNAAKHSPAGAPLRVAASVHNEQVILEVSDQGSGIGAQDLERVFEPFYRGAAPGPGSGLGLAICRAFVEANGGSVSASSTGAARGATVRIRLPVPQGEAAEAAASDD
ncbi:MAG: sensor histidine kinase [Betaproteobacteria bacterium]